MSRNGYRKTDRKPGYHNFNDHTGFRPLRKRLNRIIRRRLNCIDI